MPSSPRRRRRAVLAVGACTMVLLLAGCGSGGSTGASAPATATSVLPAATATALPRQPTPGSSTPVAPAPTSPAGHTTLAAAYSSYEVGAYYFSGWSHGLNDNINPLLTGRYRGSEPLIGWYDDSQTAVDRSIDQAADAGIDFFAFDWYDIAQSPSPTDRTLNEGLRFYLTSSQRHRLKFCLVFIDQAPFIPDAAHAATYATTRWPQLVQMWIPYFKQPGYVHVNGKPLFIIFSPEHLSDILGGPTGIHSALDLLRSRARAAGLPGVTVAIAATVAPQSNPYRVAGLNVAGYDVTTGYNYHSMGHEQYRVPVPYARLVQENVGVWNRVATRVHVPYMPVVTSGWDQRFSYREQQTAIIYAGRTPQKFACFAVLARHWVDSHPAQTTRERIVMLFAWNEIGEGGSLIPDHQDGYAYANAIRTVFGAPGHPPTTPPYCSSQ